MPCARSCGWRVHRSSTNFICGWLWSLKNILWTTDRLEERRLQHPLYCFLYCQELESIEHLTLKCCYSREVWYICCCTSAYIAFRDGIRAEPARLDSVKLGQLTS
jgi:hypothetical protein